MSGSKSPILAGRVKPGPASLRLKEFSSRCMEQNSAITGRGRSPAGGSMAWKGAMRKIQESPNRLSHRESTDKTIQYDEKHPHLSALYFKRLV